MSIAKSATFDELGVFMLFIILYLIQWWILFELNYVDPLTFNATTVCVIMASVMATIGWMVTTYNARINARKQHTINILLQARLSETFKKHREQFQENYPERPNPGFGPVPRRDIEMLKRGELSCRSRGGLRGSLRADLDGKCCKASSLESLKYLLNYYEFIANGIFNDDLDEALLRGSIRKIVIDLVYIGEEYINYFRGKNEDGSPKHEKYYEHILRLRNKWIEESELTEYCRANELIKLNDAPQPT